MYLHVLLSLCFVNGFFVQHSDADVDYILKRIGVGRCRAGCISEFCLSTGQFQDGNNLECTPTANWKCGMCWDYCDMLIEEEQTRNQMCNDDNICLDGCKLACKFYRNNQTLEKLPGSSNIVNIKLSNSLLSWNYKTGENSISKTVFVAFGLKSNEKWEELDQVSDEKISLENENQKIFGIAIFAVTARGISTYATKNATRNELPLHENINFTALDKLVENLPADLNQQGGSLYLEQWVIYLIGCSVFVILIIIFISLYFLNNKLFRNLRNKPPVPSSNIGSLSTNSVFYKDQAVTHSTGL